MPANHREILRGSEVTISEELMNWRDLEETDEISDSDVIAEFVLKEIDGQQIQGFQLREVNEETDEETDSSIFSTVIMNVKP